jgi:hypothetical protein
VYKSSLLLIAFALLAISQSGCVGLQRVVKNIAGDSFDNVQLSLPSASAMRRSSLATAQAQHVQDSEIGAVAP